MSRAQVDAHGAAPVDGPLRIAAVAELSGGRAGGDVGRGGGAGGRGRGAGSTDGARGAADPSPTAAELYRGAETVFWETANRREFAADEQRSAYRRMYFDYYWEQAPELFLLALGPTSEPAEPPQVLGYVCGVADTRRHGELYELAPHIRLFDDLYERYPAHLHINLTAASRGRGLGSELISALEDRLTGRVALAEVTDRGGSEPSQRAASPAAIPAPGLHLVTAAGARNTRFYRKNGFVDEYPRRLGAAGESAGAGPVLLFMGKGLGSAV